MIEPIIKNRAAAYRIVGVQMAVAVLIAILLLVTEGASAAVSALLGGLAYIAPNAFFTGCAFRNAGQHDPAAVLRWFYLGEAGKFVLAGLIFAAAFVWMKDLRAGALFAAYLAMIAINTVGLARMKP